MLLLQSDEFVLKIKTFVLNCYKLFIIPVFHIFIWPHCLLAWLLAPHWRKSSWQGIEIHYTKKEIISFPDQLYIRVQIHFS